jgi:hypothetical protein
VQGSPADQVEARAILAKAKLDLTRNEGGWRALQQELQAKATRLTADLCSPKDEMTPYMQGLLRGELKAIGELLHAPKRWLLELQSAQADHTVLRKTTENAKLQAEAFGADPEAQQLVQGLRAHEQQGNG